MVHFSRVATVVLDVPDGDHDRELSFWAAATGQQLPELDYDLDAEVQRLERLGAQRVEQARTWWVMRDPAGLLFCVIPEPGGTLNDSNSRRWE